jgi:hypothetical protein
VGSDRYLKERHPPTYARFLGEATLGAAIVEELAEHPRVRTMDGLRRRLAARADAGGKWLVATSLANATLARFEHMDRTASGDRAGLSLNPGVRRPIDGPGRIAVRVV